MKLHTEIYGKNYIKVLGISNGESRNGCGYGAIGVCN